MSSPNAVLFIGPRSVVPIEGPDAAVTLFDKSGGNTGNLMIAHSFAREVKNERADFWAWNNHPDLDEIRAKFKMVVFAVANWLNPYYDFSNIAKAVERLGLPCMMVGLGAQSNDEKDSHIVLQEGTRRLIELVAEHSKTIGVRGEFTAEVLANMGIHNVEVLGCPCFYAGCKPELRIKKHSAPAELSRVAISSSRNVVGASFDQKRMQAVESALLKDALRYDAAFIAQSELVEMGLALGAQTATEEELKALASYYRTVSPGKVLRFFRERCRVYGNIDEWQACLRNFQFVVGSRIHGCMVAIQAGIPAFLLVHDTRTLELAKLFSLPYKRMDDPSFVVQSPWWKRVAECTKRHKRPSVKVDIRGLYEEADFAPMAAAYARLYPKYKAFLENAGLEHNLE